MERCQFSTVKHDAERGKKRIVCSCCGRMLWVSESTENLQADCRGEKKSILDVIEEYHDPEKHDSMEVIEARLRFCQENCPRYGFEGIDICRALTGCNPTAKFADVLVRGTCKIFVDNALLQTRRSSIQLR